MVEFIDNKTKFEASLDLVHNTKIWIEYILDENGEKLKRGRSGQNKEEIEEIIDSSRNQAFAVREENENGSHVAFLLWFPDKNDYEKNNNFHEIFVNIAHFYQIPIEMFANVLSNQSTSSAVQNISSIILSDISQNQLLSNDEKSIINSSTETYHAQLRASFLFAPCICLTLGVSVQSMALNSNRKCDDLDVLRNLCKDNNVDMKTKIRIIEKLKRQNVEIQGKITRKKLEEKLGKTLLKNLNHDLWRLCQDSDIKKLMIDVSSTHTISVNLLKRLAPMMKSKKTDCMKYLKMIKTATSTSIVKKLRYEKRKTTKKKK
ncbi:unnamed protein product [Caenorhabditis angaria]|uniref:Uncharacterized protein n=1 Tax=Caenorhabditis angaria TaxID=860376 RepID=A0A9P1IIY0_9PELO|nr:unnamed protein product [Caenorhabditis angaria]